MGSPNADSVLTAKLVQDSKRVIDLNRYDEARDTEVNYQVQVTWINRKGDVIYNGAVPLPPEFTTMARASHIFLSTGNRIPRASIRRCKNWPNKLWA